MQKYTVGTCTLRLWPHTPLLKQTHFLVNEQTNLGESNQTDVSDVCLWPDNVDRMIIGRNLTFLKSRTESSSVALPVQLPDFVEAEWRLNGGASRKRLLKYQRLNVLLSCRGHCALLAYFSKAQMQICGVFLFCFVFSCDDGATQAWIETATGSTSLGLQLRSVLSFKHLKNVFVCLFIWKR